MPFYQCCGRSIPSEQPCKCGKWGKQDASSVGLPFYKCCGRDIGPDTKTKGDLIHVILIPTFLPPLDVWLDVADVNISKFPRVPSIYGLVGGVHEVRGMFKNPKLLMFCDNGISAIDMSTDTFRTNINLMEYLQKWDIFAMGPWMVACENGNISDGINAGNILQHLSRIFK